MMRQLTFFCYRNNQLIQYGVFFIVLLLQLILLMRNPFSDRNLIANLEPFPDTFYYIQPGRNWLEGRGWTMTRPGTDTIQTAVPPLYGIALWPFVTLFNDPRAFYLSNVVIALATTYVFLLLTAGKVSTPWQFLVGLLWVANLIHYWLPTLAMAENLLLFFIILAAWLLERRISTRFAFFLGLMSWSFYATKYAAAPITVIFFLVALYRSWYSKQSLAVIAGGFIGFLILQLWQWQVVGTSLLGNLIFVIKDLLLEVQVDESGKSTSLWAFSLQDFPVHLKAYGKAVFGFPQTFLWSVETYWQPWLAGISMSAYGYLAYMKRWTSSIAFLFVSMILQVIFMATFYVVDIRYIIIVLPTILFGFVLFLALITKQKSMSWFTVGAIVALIGIYGYSTLARAKSHIRINYLSAETPWYYVSFQDLNRVLATQTSNTFVIVSSEAFLSDYYGNGKYTALPLTPHQDFFPTLETMNTTYQLHATDWTEVYSQLIQIGARVLYLEYGVGHDKVKKHYESELSKNFTLKLVSTGCHQLCDIYELEL